MVRFDRKLIERAERFSHRMVDLSEALARAGKSHRIVEQIVGCGTSVGANVCEADEAVSSPDFCRVLGVVVREASESQFWIRFVAKRDWLRAKRLEGLEQESSELRAIFGSMIARTRRRTSPRVKIAAKTFA